MPDQNSPAFLGQLRDLARGILSWAAEEQGEQQHAPASQPQPASTDINQPPKYPEKSAAGMLLLAPDGRALFVRRAKDARDHAGTWSIPGGMSEGDESPWQTAQRETQEEVGDCGVDRGQLLDHRDGYTTFGGKVADNFRPTLDGEHDGYQWANMDAPPQPLHPGLKATLDFAMDPLTEKGEKIMKSMQSQYGPEKGKQVFYASKNAGKLSGVDTIPTTGRQDRTIGPNGPPETPFSANLDWDSPSWDQIKHDPKSGQFMSGAGGGGATSSVPSGKISPYQLPPRQSTAPQFQPNQRVRINAPTQAAHHGKPGFIIGKGPLGGYNVRMQQSGRLLTSMQSHQLEGIDAADQTGKTAEIAEAVQGKVRDPQAVAAATRAKMIGRPALQAKAAVARSGDAAPSEAELAKRFVLRDTQTGQDYALDEPVAATFTPQRGQDEWASPDQGQDAGGGAGGWGHQGTAPPQQGPDPMVQPADQRVRRPMGMRQPMGGGGRGMMRGAGHGREMAMGGGGPKYSHSVKVDYGGGVVDERKFTRPMPNAVPPQEGQMDAWASPDQGWPTATSAGPSPKGGRAGATATPRL